MSETVADRLADAVATLQGVGLRSPSILRGMEIATKRLRDEIAKEELLAVPLSTLQ